ncbi:cytochrome c family protein [Pelagibius litoralis]|uniref:Cytochrome c family protein n=2 Tax=Pelagibius litoralis TaxID=374515 RepID=A0A967CA95_9PROT|nr:cytochrome c family protein [Pelagibius litoralis]
MFSAGLSATLLALAFATPVAAAGDQANGQKLFKKCSACHSLEEGKKKVGPSLYKIFGATPGQVAKFRYSKGMTSYGATGVVWDEETLDAWLTKPKDLVKKTKMAFPGFKKEQDRADVIAYLKSLSE